MVDNVVKLPRPNFARPDLEPLGLYLRVGRNQHNDLLDVLSSGEKSFHGLVIDAVNANRHSDLINHALDAGLDVTLDPKTHAMALPGGFSASMASLPWGLEQHHTLSDFQGDAGYRTSVQISEFAQKYRFTQILGPTHLLTSANDPWLRHDVSNMVHMRNHLQGTSGHNIELVYPLALPMQVLRNSAERAAVIAAIADAPVDAIWLRIENFGSDATGEKTIAYIEAARDFHALGIPVIADHVGGLCGLGLVASSCVGGLSHGITLLETFKASHWRRPYKKGGATPATRVYIPRLDIHLKKADAEAFLRSSTRTRGRFGCPDTHCCSDGINGMLNNPTKHFVHQKSQQMEAIAGIPESLRLPEYLEKYVRPISDDVSAAAGLNAISDQLKKALAKKQKTLGRYRQTFAHFARADQAETIAQKPILRSRRG